MHNILYNNSNSSINGSVPPYYNYNYNDVVNNEMNVNHQQQQTPFVVQNACGNEIYGHKTVDVNSIVKEKVLETVLRERITKENAMRENELRKMLQREKQLREKEESIVKDKDKRILELENKEKLLETQLLISKNIGYISSEVYDTLIPLVLSIESQLSGLIRKVRQ